MRTPPARCTRKTLLRYGLSALLLLGSLSFYGCNSGATGGEADGKIDIVATVGMIGDAAKNIGGEYVEVTSLMGPGVDPHLYKATAGDVQTLNNAEMILYGGLELEGRMTEIFEKMARSGKPTVAVGEAIPKELLRQPPEFKGRYDPHLWFDVTLWKQVVATIREELARHDPAHAQEYRQNAAAYLKQLDDLHQYVQAEINKIPESRRVLITAHDAFGYFGKQYGMEVKGLQGTSTATEAGAKDVQALADLIVKRKIPAIFVESSVPQATIEAVQAAVKSQGWDVKIGGQLYSDAMGPDGTPEGTYIGMFRHNVDTISKALRG
ncbi:MAG: zinc ABC transporter substrate-binding protein [Armatimonadetes bacterium]|nr:zinc ABC transporter substrate-binding protein [Armatimonadota bacterium]